MKWKLKTILPHTKHTYCKYLGMSKIFLNQIIIIEHRVLLFDTLENLKLPIRIHFMHIHKNWYICENRLENIVSQNNSLPLWVL